MQLLFLAINHCPCPLNYLSALGRSVGSVVALQSALQQHQKKCTHNSIIKRTLRLLIARIAGGGGKTIARLSA